MLFLFVFLLYPILQLCRFAGEEPEHYKVGTISGLLYLGVYPLFVILGNVDGEALDCYMHDQSLTFAADHLLSVAVPFLGASAAYFYCFYRTRCAPPLLEVLLNGTLVIGIILHAIVGYQYWGKSVNIFLFLLQLVMIPGAIALLLIQLVRNHRLLVQERFSTTPELVGDEPASGYQTVAGAYRQHGFYGLLTFPLFVKSPFLLIAMIPYLLVLDALLLLFGQQPDSIVLAFTQTYYKGFSALKPVCNIMPYESHYLCSVAAGGHPGLVRPVRMGRRGGKAIVCNRQLLVANAFEELLQEHLPAMHRIIRRYYDQVGNFIHKDYTPYQNPWLCDAIYLLMKPADWCFRVVLYLCDRRPEERIARQYL